MNALATPAPQAPQASRSGRPLVFVRHGATEPNLAGLRCGGDLDVALTALGRLQARDAACRLRDAGAAVSEIVTSALQRTVETAAIVSEVLGGVPVRTEPAFAERALGRWNLLPIAATAAAMRRGETPPDGEAAEDFKARIAAAAQALLRQPSPCPLLIGSKGVARVLRELLGVTAGEPPRNGEIVTFDLAPLAHHRAEEPAA